MGKSISYALILIVVLSSLFAFSLISEVASNPSPIKSVVILIDPNISFGVNQSVTTFINDLTHEGYNVLTHLSTETSPEEIRDYLKDLYFNAQPKLVGAILFGDIPKPYYNISYPATDQSFQRGPYLCISYEFYEDLDGDYFKAQSSDNFYSVHSGNVTAEIWVSILPYYFNETTTVKCINGYLQKNHLYRNFENRVQRGYANAILGVMPSMEMYQQQITAILDPTYYWYPIDRLGNILIGVDNYLGNSTLYPNARDVFEGMMSDKYDFAIVGAHGSGIGWYYDNGTCLIDVNWAETHPIQTHFIIDGSCSNGNIDLFPNLLTAFLYNAQNKVIFVEGSTCPGGGLGENVEGYYAPIVSRKLIEASSLGEANQYYFSKDLVGTFLEQREMYTAQNILLGDGTLRLVEFDISPTVPELSWSVILPLLVCIPFSFLLLRRKLRFK